jgi:hypothetical protein
MDKKILNRSGLIGAVILILVTLLSLMVPSISSLAVLKALWMATVGACFLTGILGYVTGRMGAKSQSVGYAMRTAGLCYFIATTVCALPAVVVMSYRFSERLATMAYYLGFYSIVVFTCAGALLSGLAAIAARDYRQFQRPRLIPQFSMGELFIVVTLVAVILGSVMSIVLYSEIVTLQNSPFRR